MAESLFWFPGYNWGYINQVVQKNVRCLLTRIMSTAGVYLCPRNALISGKPCWSWETPALTDPPSTILPYCLDCPQGANPFLLQNFPPIFCTFTLTWSSPSRLHSCLKTEVTAVSPLDFSQLYGKIVWFTVIHCCCFPFCLPQRGRMC